MAGHEEFKRMEFKLDRIQSLLSHYAMEIDTLLMMDDAISNFRGNDIMKTLTIFTALFTPAAVVGGIWGMNFKPYSLDIEALGLHGYDPYHCCIDLRYLRMAMEKGLDR